MFSGRAVLRLVAGPAASGATGRYYDGTREARADPQAYDAAARDRLRRLSDRLVRRALGDRARPEPES
ncbi:hypothetical protein GCM10009760_13970 [Kitasatospora kazusensis]|uniref:Uncharacterized protein n=1 Tax=Kitasatospora kazusensis TaxID=407974 RepID=A0ABN2Z1P1_9ACTN